VKELSPERRALLAFVLSMLVLLAWSLVFQPEPQKPPEPPPAAESTAPAPAGQAPPAAAPVSPAKVQVAPAAAAPVVKAAAAEQVIVVENDLYRVEFSNRGGVVRSWQLKDYRDAAKPPKTLDVVQPESAQQLGAWPLGLALDDARLEGQVNAALYEVTPAARELRAPAELIFEWSDGRIEVTKRLKFESSYVVEVETSVMLDGQPLAHALAWRGGFGDATVYVPHEHVSVFFHAEGKLKALPHKNLGAPDHPEQRLRHAGALDYSGIQDRYFAVAFLPRVPGGGGLALWHWRMERDVALQNGKKERVPVAEMAAGTTQPGPVALRLFVGPKDLDVLASLRPPMKEMVDFGWFSVLALPLFYFLKWLYAHAAANYGWAIVLMTVVINTVLFPLKIKSFRSMQKMQKVAPEIKSIQERYKKYSMRDPRRQQMQQEIMGVYKREGINPAGGCLPMLLQMPIWIALYQMLLVAIELRHAPWIGWIRDLSAPDPYYILPVLMGLTMYLMQKMTPMTATDPAQQRMMTMMPIIFGGMFVIFPISSGLVLYILTSNVVGMAQQWYLNRSLPAKAPATGKRKK
jgi:YidC/Oxa1 family membrane protein insertase